MTIKDIARISGYSVGTVSRVLNSRPDASPAAKEKILAVVEQYHFRLNNNAKHLKQQSSSSVAVIVKGTKNMLFATLVERIQELARAGGYACLIYYIDEDGNELEQAMQIIQDRKPLGLVFLGCNPGYFQKSFSAIDLPCVLLTNSAAELDFPNLSSVCTNDSEAAATAVSTLIALGHKRIAVLGGRMGCSAAATARFQGCLRAFESYGIPFEPECQHETARFAMGSGYAAMERLLDKMPDLTAVFAMSDVQAVGGIRALHDRGLRVPEDISVMGFDGIEMGNYLTPKLATVEQDARRMADRGMEILFERITRSGGPVHEYVPFSLRAGESIASCPAPQPERHVLPGGESASYDRKGDPI
jgi:LacI family transcriptional regulator